MSIAKIVAPMTGGKRDGTVLATAFAAARPFNAHVVALLISPDPRLTVPTMGAPLSPQVAQNIIDTTEELNRAAVRAVQATLAQAAAAAGATIVTQREKAQSMTCSFEQRSGFFTESVAMAARLSDLVVFGPIATADGPDMNECFVEILTKSDRPVLLSEVVPKKLTGQIAIAWDGGAAATHAVIAALPFLTRAQNVAVFCVGAERPDDRPETFVGRKTGLHELKDYLSLHGVAFSELVFQRGTKNTGEALLAAALDARADLLVMGGYGHSHLRETLFGGVTDHIRWHAELPVLMVH